MYKELWGEHADVPWKRIFFQNHASPRAKFILWLTLMGRMPTKDRLVKFGFIQDKTCYFCPQDETLKHLLFECSYTKRIWDKRSISSWDNEKLWLIHETTKKGWRREIFRISLAKTIHKIWLTRNDVVFNHNPLVWTLSALYRIK